MWRWTLRQCSSCECVGALRSGCLLGRMNHLRLLHKSTPCTQPAARATHSVPGRVVYETCVLIIGFLVKMSLPGCKGRNKQLGAAEATKYPPPFHCGAERSGGWTLDGKTSSEYVSRDTCSNKDEVLCIRPRYSTHISSMEQQGGPAVQSAGILPYASTATRWNNALFD